MKVTRYLLLAFLLIVLLIPFVTADDMAFGNVTGNYTVTSGNDQIQIFTNIPLTVEDIAFPVVLFYFFAVFGFVMLILGVVLTAKSDSVPAMAITACGMLAFGCFLIAAFMAPYVATQTIVHQVIPVNSTANKIYISEVNVYSFSSWVGYAMWGGAVAGILMAFLGGLSYIGWFHRKGIKDARKGKYVETDVDGDEPQRGKY